VEPQSGGGRDLSADARRILAVQALRAYAYGLGSVLIGVTLADSGLSAGQVGLVLGALLAGSAFASFALARGADRRGRRRSYATLLIVMGIAGSVFALTDSLPLLVLAALTGTVSTEVVESGPFTTLEQAMLPQAADTHDPTRLFGTYNTVATIAGSIGALGAVAVGLLDLDAQQLMFVYPLAAGIALVPALRLTAGMEPDAPTSPVRRGLGRSRGVVHRLAGFFALDSFGGGFVTQAFIAYWFVERFGTSTATLGVVFLCVGFLQAFSFQIAVRLAGRIGLLRTMVFTHLPSNVLLLCIPLAPTQAVAIALLLARVLLSQMDVPTRQAYVVALVDPEERTAAAGTTNGVRYVTRPIGALLTGPLVQLSLGAPFVVAGAVKIVYDVGLYGVFRRVDPPDISS
jgi:predicted MFS family arabinose efflux permease